VDLVGAAGSKTAVSSGARGHGKEEEVVGEELGVDGALGVDQQNIPAAAIGGARRGATLVSLDPSASTSRARASADPDMGRTGVRGEAALLGGSCLVGVTLEAGALGIGRD